jgi:hypothetical protein
MHSTSKVTFLTQIAAGLLKVKLETAKNQLKKMWLKNPQLQCQHRKISAFMQQLSPQPNCGTIVNQTRFLINDFSGL